MTEYVVRRTSVWDDDVAPCAGAYKRKYTYVDARTFKSPEEHDSKLCDRWADLGTNHRIMPYGIARDFERDAWFIHVDDLMAFVAEHGSVVLSIDASHNPPMPSIEIYDGYRE